MDRLPAFPLLASDPYISVWMPADKMTATDSAHWSGPVKPITGTISVDGKAFRFLGVTHDEEAVTEDIKVTPTSTAFVSSCGGVKLTTVFTTPALPDDPDLMSMPVTLVTFTVESADGEKHAVSLDFFISDRICYNGDIRPKMVFECYDAPFGCTAWCGQQNQKVLSLSGDHTTIDWGYLYLTGSGDISCAADGLRMNWNCEAFENAQTAKAVIAYDDVASINHFGDHCKAWYRRNGAQVTDALAKAVNEFDSIKAHCAAIDARVIADAQAAGGEDYVLLASAAWRQCLAAHKLIATPKGEMAFLSKENDSNGCIGTVDVSYPSIPLMLRYNPELVNALCRPVLEFASMPVWSHMDFAPHDVGRYPNATGQVYAAKRGAKNGETYLPFYLYPADSDVYNGRNQMPVEESGNMLIMLESAIEFGADRSLADAYLPLLGKWVKYLITYGEDPGEQLCTDDFAGHLAHNVNLAAKAIVGVACYGRLTGDESMIVKAKEMAARLTAKIGTNGDTPLTLEGNGWSMKYNLLWDKVLSLGLMSDSFYKAETESYLAKQNTYGLPLDSRADYTKSDWICWTSAIADDMEVRKALLAPIAKYLRETTTRVAFSDWYDTKTGRYVQFIARSVQGGILAPMLRLPR